MTAAHLDRLNDRQRAAVAYGIDDPAAAGPLLIIAGAGSGKTDTLAHRVAHLVVNGADPGRILLMTFSRRAASEMTARAGRISARMLGRDAESFAAALSWSGTFHAIGARILREYAAAIGLDPGFTILDREDSADLLALVRHDLGLSTTEKRFPTKATCLALYSRSVNAERPLDEVIATHFPWTRDWEKELTALFAAYVEAKQAENVLDYDDLLLWWAQAMSEPTLAAEIGGRFDHVLVDEYQDTNRLQASILTALKPDGRGLTVVGDDAQSIYSFRAATVRNILDFPAAFDRPAEVITLDRNYRSTRPILAAANAVIGLAKERFTKNLWSDRESTDRPRLITVRDEADQAKFVALEILRNRETGMSLKDQAVLVRAAHHGAALEVELVRRNIPFVKFGGLKFLDAAHVKDLLAVLRFAENPRDRVAGFRVLQLLPGVGPSTAKGVLEAIAGEPDPIACLLARPAPPRAGAEWSAFVALLGELGGGRLGWPAELAAARIWYDPHLRRHHEDDVEMRRADLLQLEAIAAGHPSRSRFLTELTLDPPDATSGEAGPPSRDEDWLTLSTIHSAKGREWRAVFVLDVVDGCIPSDLATGTSDEIEEERRLLYVAMTRAKDALTLMIPQRFFTLGQSPTGDRHVYAARTRFIPAPLLALFSAAAWPVGSAEAVAGRAAGTPRIVVAARMRAMWRR
jgi:DNA helicase-2/ATP-dependent DNA helicase PcrA